MPIPQSQSLLLSLSFREKLSPIERAELDNLLASLQQQVGGIGVTRHLDASEVVLTGSGTGRVTRNANPTYTQVSYALIERELMLVNFYFLGLVVQGTPTFIQLQIPGGYQCKYGEWINVPGILDDIGVLVFSRIIVSQGVFPGFVPIDQISIGRADGANLSNTGANTTSARGQIIIPITQKPVVA